MSGTAWRPACWPPVPRLAFQAASLLAAWKKAAPLAPLSILLAPLTSARQVTGRGLLGETDHGLLDETDQPIATRAGSHESKEVNCHEVI